MPIVVKGDVTGWKEHMAYKLCSPANSVYSAFGASVHKVHHFSRTPLSKNRPEPRFFGVLDGFPLWGCGEFGALGAPMHQIQNKLN